MESNDHTMYKHKTAGEFIQFIPEAQDNLHILTKEYIPMFVCDSLLQQRHLTAQCMNRSPWYKEVLGSRKGLNLKRQIIQYVKKPTTDLKGSTSA